MNTVRHELNVWIKKPLEGWGNTLIVGAGMAHQKSREIPFVLTSLFRFLGHCAYSRAKYSRIWRSSAPSRRSPSFMAWVSIMCRSSQLISYSTHNFFWMILLVIYRLIQDQTSLFELLRLKRLWLRLSPHRLLHPSTSICLQDCPNYYLILILGLHPSFFP
jgi:hypothetical protein